MRWIHARTVHSTEAATFRFDKAVLDKLRKEAKQKQISLNALLNQIVKSHIEWHANAASVGFMPVRKKMIMKVFDSLTDEQINAVASSLSQDISDGNLMILVREHTPRAWLEFMENWLRAAGINYRRENAGDYVTFLIQHDMGAKWSYYLACLFEGTASTFLSLRPDIKAAKNALRIKLKMM